MNRTVVPCVSRTAYCLFLTLPLVLLFTFVSPLQAFGNSRFVPIREGALRILKLVHLSIKIMNLLAESTHSTASPPTQPSVAIMTYHHTPNPRALSASLRQKVGSHIRCVVLVLLRIKL
jgi:hypothetical protein